MFANRFVFLKWKKSACEVVQRKCFHDSVKTNDVGLTFASMTMTTAVDGPADGTNLSGVGEIRLVPDHQQWHSIDSKLVKLDWTTMVLPRLKLAQFLRAFIL